MDNDKLIELDDKMRDYASMIIQSVDQTYNQIFPENCDFEIIKNCLVYDESLIDEAEDFYKEHFKDLCRNETDDFFVECSKYINSVKKLIASKKPAQISESKNECRCRILNLIDSVRGTILEDKDVLSDLTIDSKRGLFIAGKSC